MNKIATMPGAIQEADRPTSPECTEGLPNTDACVPDGDLMGFEDTDAFRIEYDLWYPEEQVIDSGFGFAYMPNAINTELTWTN